MAYVCNKCKKKKVKIVGKNKSKLYTLSPSF